MDELLQRALVHLRAMWHRRWIGLAAAWIVAIVGIAVAFRIPERFEASARVYVDTQSLLRPVMAGTRHPTESRSAGGVDEPYAD